LWITGSRARPNGRPGSGVASPAQPRYSGTVVVMEPDGDLIGGDADPSTTKVFQTELFQRITDTMLEIAGENAGLMEPIEGNRDLHPTGLYIQARPATIYGGSNEVQSNIISKRILGLPDLTQSR
jgi:alkylation response protein AidB-like acyl-CoA dehydrogenase